MTDIKNITISDVQFASAYFTLLVEVALRGETIAYSSLVELSKKRFKKNKVVQKGIATTVGRRLNVLRQHTNKLKLADISSLVVSKGKVKPGDAYHLDSEKERLKVYETHWLDSYCQIQNSLALQFNALRSISSNTSSAKPFITLCRSL